MSSAPDMVIRTARLFRNNRSQAVRIPVEFEFPGNRVLIHKEGNKLIIEPDAKLDLIDVLKALAPLDAADAFPADIDDTLPQVEASLAAIEILARDGPADIGYGDIRADLEAVGRAIGPNDLLIAAHAYALRATLVTANVAEFNRVRGLEGENWLA